MGLATIIRKCKEKEREIRILILGLDNSGKSTCLARWLKQDPTNIAPTFGFQIKTLEQPTFRAVLWDIGGQASLRPFWRTYFEDAGDGLIWIIDSSDVIRLNEGLGALAEQLNLAKCLVLGVIANKQDLEGALKVEEIEKYLRQLIPNNIQWKIFGGSALTEPGEIVEAFDWLTTEIRKNKLSLY